MKVISIPEIASRIRQRRSGKFFLAKFIQQCSIEDAIIIPNNATNGDVIMTMFDCMVIEIFNGKVYVEGIFFPFDEDWWNAPYKKEVRE